MHTIKTKRPYYNCITFELRKKEKRMKWPGDTTTESKSILHESALLQLSITAALYGNRNLTVPAAAARAAEVAWIGVVSRSTRLASAVSRLFLAAIVAVVVARAAGLFPGAAVAVAVPFSS
jgi:hypothetical protein